jgi:iron(III) transport system substrate-binding protein
MKKIFALTVLAAASSFSAGLQAQTVNVICSVQAEWCNMIGTVYARTTGVKINISMKGSGEALAQIIAEKDNPKTDIWFGGTGDPHLQAAEQNLSLEYKSPSLPQLHGWAQQQAAQSGYKTVVLAITPSWWPKRNWPCPKRGATCSTRR